jgi:glutamyl-tRNA reductase
MPRLEPAKAETVFPVCLLLSGRPCLVVGGGRVAVHKVRLLLDGLAHVTVVSPKVNDEIARWTREERVCHLPREYTESDLDGVFLVFVATDNRDVNRSIVECCRERGILCCAADGNWTSGDFLTPAVFRQEGLTVAISTGGQSCRRSRMMKDNLSRHVALMQTADLLVLGTSHQQLTVSEREPFHLIGQRLQRAGQMLSQIWGIHEFMLLNTCNRVEVHAVVSRQADLVPLLTSILGLDRLEPGQFYVKRGDEAFEHVAVLTAGLLSQTPGENHIVAQVKDALERSLQAGWARGMMQEWVDSALHVSKDIRNVTTPLLRTSEIEDVCLAYVRAESPELEDGGILVLGSGMVGLGITRRLAERGRRVDLCYHLHRPELYDSWKGRVRLFTFDDLRDRLAKADLVICATDSPHYVLMAEHAPCFGPERPLLVCDLTMPRNVDPALGGLRPKLKVADLEDLKHWYRREGADLSRIIELSLQTVSEHMELYERISWSLGNGEPSADVARAVSPSAAGCPHMTKTELCGV